jgi:hypothetical protein
MRPDDAMRARVRAAIVATMPTATDDPPAKAQAQTSVLGASGIARIWIVPLAGMLATVAGIVGLMALRDARPGSRVAVERAVVASATPSDAAATVSPEPQPLPVRAKTSKPAGDLRAEMAVLQRAEAALRAGRSERALRETRAHRTLFPDGELREERQGLELIALCALERDVRKPLALYLALHPRPVLAPRVRIACNVDKP